MTHARSTIAELESERSRRLQKRERIAERIGRFVVLTMPLLGLLGLFGQGLFSERIAASEDGRVRVVYEAVERRSAPCTLRVRIEPKAGDRDVRVTLSREFADRTALDSSVPVPDAVEADDTKVTYLFRGHSDKPLEIVYRFTHEQFGPATFTVGVEGESAVSARQWVLP